MRASRQRNGRRNAKARSSAARDARRRGGSSLIETVVALAILAYGAMGVTAGQILAMNYSSNSRVHKVAMYLAEQRIETFHLMPAADVLTLGSGSDPPFDPDPGDDTAMQFTRRWTIAPDTAGSTAEVGVMTITVLIDWTDANQVARTTRLQTIKANL